MCERLVGENSAVANATIGDGGDSGFRRMRLRSKSGAVAGFRRRAVSHSLRARPASQAGSVQPQQLVAMSSSQRKSDKARARKSNDERKVHETPLRPYRTKQFIMMAQVYASLHRHYMSLKESHGVSSYK